MPSYSVVSQWLNGWGAGALSYGACTGSESVKSGTTYTFSWTRIFTNGSAGAITVNEIGIYFYRVFTSTAYYFCAARDKLAAGVTINPGSAKTVQYDISVTD